MEEKIWWNYLPEDLQELLRESVKLNSSAKSWQDKFHDYSFIVFPAAKAYEGYLKKVFLDMGFMSKDDYYGKHFRVGKALNPSLDEKYRAESVYDKIVNYCKGKDLADSMWETWKSSRNLLFHWFPDEKNAISYEEAGERIDQILGTMDKVTRECKIA